jgi:uncharacterized protein (TIGR02391 family)
MARRIPPLDSVAPSLSTHRSIELLRVQLEKLDEVAQRQYDDPEVKKWEVTTENILHGAFGKPNGRPHENTQEFDQARWSGSFHMGMSRGELQHKHALAQGKRKALLESFIEQLEILAPPGVRAAQDQYRFHPEIERVSGELYRDGHYKQAALEAYIRVIDEVKARSGLDLDGDRLMNVAFACDNQIPVIQFNALQSDVDRDEQRGFMFLFKGIVGQRNLKAHSNRLFNDPYRAHDYLALASLLMRVLEIATVNRV